MFIHTARRRGVLIVLIENSKRQSRLNKHLWIIHNFLIMIILYAFSDIIYVSSNYPTHVLHVIPHVSVQYFDFRYTWTKTIFRVKFVYVQPLYDPYVTNNVYRLLSRVVTTVVLKKNIVLYNILNQMVGRKKYNINIILPYKCINVTIFFFLCLSKVIKL